jgi:hypothetical protein
VGGDDRSTVAKHGRRDEAWVGVGGSRAREKKLSGAGGRGGCGVSDVGDGPQVEVILPAVAASVNGPPVEAVLRATATSALVDGPPVEVGPPRPMGGGRHECEYIVSVRRVKVNLAPRV